MQGVAIASLTGTKRERVNLVRHVLPVLPTASNARYDGCAGPRTYVVYVSVDAQSLAIQHDGQSVLPTHLGRDTERE